VCICGCSTCGELPAGVPSGQAGPRLIAFSGLLMTQTVQAHLNHEAAPSLVAAA